MREKLRAYITRSFHQYTTTNVEKSLTLDSATFKFKVTDNSEWAREDGSRRRRILLHVTVDSTGRVDPYSHLVAIGPITFVNGLVDKDTISSMVEYLLEAHRWVTNANLAKDEVGMAW